MAARPPTTFYRSYSTGNTVGQSGQTIWKQRGANQHLPPVATDLLSRAITVPVTAASPSLPDSGAETDSISTSPQLADGGTGSDSLTVSTTQRQVIASAGGSTADGILLRVIVLTAVATEAAIIANSAGQGSQSGIAAHEVTITTSVVSSVVWAVDENGNAGSVDPTAGETVLDGFLDTVNSQGYGTFFTVPTVTPGAYTAGSPDSFNGSAAALEILPATAGTPPATDASSPPVAVSQSATTVRTLPFVPPAGSLVMALVSSNGGSGVATMSVSDTLGLTWTQVQAGDATANQYAGIWLATVPGGSVPVALADSGAGSDALATAHPLADSGAGTDSLSISAVQPLADSGSETDSVLTSPQLPDSGTGSDALSYPAAVPVSDTGSGTDVLLPDPQLADSGSLADSLTAGVVISLPDSGAGTDTIISGHPLADSGAQADALSTAAALALADSGAQTDSLLTGPRLADSGTESDSISYPAAIPLAETGAGTDGLVPDPQLADSGAETESITAGVAIPLPDSGTGSDALAVTIPLPDSAAGTDALAVAAAAALADSGAGSDALATTPQLSDSGAETDTLAYPAAVPLPDSGTMADSLSAGGATSPSLPDSGTQADTLVTSPQLADSGVGSDALSYPAAVPLAEAGSGTDSMALSASVPLADAGAGTDALTVAASLALSDSGAGTSTLAVTASAALADGGSAADSLLTAASVQLAESGSVLDRLIPLLNVSLAETGSMTDSFITTAITGDTGNVFWFAMPAGSRWSAAAASQWEATIMAGRWTAESSPAQWDAQPAAPYWEVYMTNFMPIAALSLENVNVTWASELAGTSIDPTGQTSGQAQLVVEFAFPVSSGNPLRPAEPATWYTGEWLEDTTSTGYIAQCLVGPGGGLVTLTAGQSYDVWSKILGTPEEPCKYAGTINVY